MNEKSYAMQFKLIHAESTIDETFFTIAIVENSFIKTQFVVKVPNTAIPFSWPMLREIMAEKVPRNIDPVYLNRV